MSFRVPVEILQMSLSPDELTVFVALASQCDDESLQTNPISFDDLRVLSGWLPEKKIWRALESLQYRQIIDWESDSQEALFVYWIEPVEAWLERQEH